MGFDRGRKGDRGGRGRDKRDSFGGGEEFGGGFDRGFGDRGGGFGASCLNAWNDLNAGTKFRCLAFPERFSYNPADEDRQTLHRSR